MKIRLIILSMFLVVFLGKANATFEIIEDWGGDVCDGLVGFDLCTCLAQKKCNMSITVNRTCKTLVFNKVLNINTRKGHEVFRDRCCDCFTGQEGRGCCIMRQLGRQCRKCNKYL